MWSSTVSGTPLSSSRGKWSRTAGALIAPSLAKVTTCTHCGRRSRYLGRRTCRLSSGRRVLEPEQKRLREASGDEQDSERERERERGGDESKCKHDRRDSRKHSFERARLRQEMRERLVSHVGSVGLQPSAVPCPWHSAHSCPTWSRPFPTTTGRGRRGRRSRGNSARSTGERTSRPPVDPPADSSRGCAARGHSPAASYTTIRAVRAERRRVRRRRLGMRRLLVFFKSTTSAKDCLRRCRTAPGLS